MSSPYSFPLITQPPASTHTQYGIFFDGHLRNELEAPKEMQVILPKTFDR